MFKLSQLGDSQGYGHSLGVNVPCLRTDRLLHGKVIRYYFLNKQSVT